MRETEADTSSTGFLRPVYSRLNAFSDAASSTPLNLSCRLSAVFTSGLVILSLSIVTLPPRGFTSLMRLAYSGEGRAISSLNGTGVADSSSV